MLDKADDLKRSDRIQQLLRRACDFHQKGKLAQAERLYQQIFEIWPGHFDACHLLGVLRHQQARNHEAIELIGAALQRKPNDVVALSNYGVVLDELKRYDE